MYKTILSIDTTLNQTSIALLHKKKIDTEIKFCQYKHEKNILTMINNIIKRNNIKIYDCEVIIFASGPGNFTGIRIGTNISQGLSIAYPIHLIGISTLKSLAEQAWRIKKIKKVIVCIKANKKKIYWGKYIRQKNVWILQEQESYLTIYETLKKIKYLKNTWHIIGSGQIYFQSIKNKFLKFININIPYAQDLITITLSECILKNQPYNQIKLNYLNNRITK